MNILRWITWVALAIGCVLVLLRGRSNRGLLVLTAAIATQLIADLFRETPVGYGLLVVSTALMIWAGFLTVRQVRAQWREQMERVKHL